MIKIVNFTGSDKKVADEMILEGQYWLVRCLVFQQFSGSILLLNCPLVVNNHFIHHRIYDLSHYCQQFFLAA